MPSLLAATDEKNESAIYEIILKNIIQKTKTGLISDDADIHSGISAIKDITSSGK